MDALPFSPFREAGDLVFFSGQGGFDPATGRLACAPLVMGMLVEITVSRTGALPPRGADFRRTPRPSDGRGVLAEFF